jgi:hypothetical protein
MFFQKDMKMKVLLFLVFFILLQVVIGSNKTVSETQGTSSLINSSGIVRVISKILDFPHAIWNLRVKIPWNDLEKHIDSLIQISGWILRISLDTTVVTLTDTLKNRLAEIRATVNNVKTQYAQAEKLFSIAQIKKPLAKIFQKIANRIPFIPWTTPDSASGYTLNKSKQTVFLTTPDQFLEDIVRPITDQLPEINQATQHNDWKDVKNWPEYLENLSHRAIFLTEMTDKLLEFGYKIIDGQLPSLMFPPTLLTEIVNEIRKEYPMSLSETTDEDIIRIYAMPMTFSTYEQEEILINSSKVTLRNSYIYAFHFVTPAFNRFDYSTLHTIPMPVENEDPPIWRKYVPTQLNFLINEGQKWAINQDAFSCIEDSTSEIVPLCFFQEFPNVALDECSREIFQNGNIFEKCPFKESKEIHSTAIQIRPNKWVYSLEKDAAMKEICDSQSDKNINLPIAGTLEFKPNCQYKITNGPFQGVFPFSIQNRYELNTGQVFPIKPKTAHPIQEHFKNHGYIYLMIIFGLIFLLLTSSILLYIRIRFQNIQQNRNERSVQYVSRPRLNENDHEIGEAAAHLIIEEMRAATSGRPHVAPLALRAV